MGKKENLQSELPVEKLVELSMGLTDKHTVSYFTAVKRSSPVLSPASASLLNAILDKAGAVAYLAEAKNRASNYEEYLRALWHELERHSTLNGFNSENGTPGGREAEDIMEAACRLKVVLEEITKLNKMLSERETQEKQLEQNRRLHQGVFKRDAKGKIWLADGMAVGKDGIIPDLGMHIDQYLDECKEEREEKHRIVVARFKEAEAAASA